MEIVCQADEKMVPDCAVMLHSLLTTNQAADITINFLCDAGASDSTWQPLEDLVSSLGASWKHVRISPEQLLGLPFAESYGGYAACYRLLLADLLPDTSRVLYLDADIVVLDDLTPLWTLDLDNCYVAACTNPLYRHMERRLIDELGLPDRRAYFNSGVLVFDLDLMRRDGAQRELVDWASAHRESVSWPDQDALNAVLWRRRMPLHPRWNAVGGLWELPQRDLPWPPEVVADARRSPAIAHFLGFKPWHYRCKHPYRTAYDDHLLSAGIAPRKEIGRTLRNRLLRPLPALAQWTAENGTLEVRTEIKQRVARTVVGATVRPAYRRLRGLPSDPVATLLEALDASIQDLVFVQVGSNDGENDDPLRRFILAGEWRGLMIEPVPYIFERLRNNYRGRAGVRLVCAAIGDHDGSAEFFSIAESGDDLPGWYDQIGSWSRDHLLKHAEYIPDLERRIVSLEVPCLTFESLCRREQLDHIDLIHIDAEGYDLEVLKAIDFAKHAPALVMYEYKHLSREDRATSRSILQAAGYDLVDIGWDTFAARRERLTGRWSKLGRAWNLARREAVAFDE